MRAKIAPHDGLALWVTEETPPCKGSPLGARYTCGIRMGLIAHV